jgi:hypothetical protein
MSNFKWVCFDCRMAVRRHGWAKDVRCPSCARPCLNLGTKAPLPPKTRVRDWLALRDRHYEFERRRALRQERERVTSRHALERRIRALEARPASRGRTLLIRQLRARLVRMTAEAGVHA